MAAHRKGKPGRKKGFKHSAATKKKISAAHKARHRRKHNQRLKYKRRDKATHLSVRRTMRQVISERKRRASAVKRRRNPGPGRPRKAQIARLMRRRRAA